MSNEVNLVNQEQNQHQTEEKTPLQDLDLSHLILIKNPNNEVAIGKNKLNNFIRLLP